MLSPPLKSNPSSRHFDSWRPAKYETNRLVRVMVLVHRYLVMQYRASAFEIAISSAGAMQRDRLDSQISQQVAAKTAFLGIADL